MSLVVINWRPTRKELRTFGLTMLIGFGILWMLFTFAPWPVPWSPMPLVGAVLLVIGHVLGLPALAGHRAALPGYWAWMGISYVLGSIMSRVVMAVLYFGIVTPLSLLTRLVGRDRLGLRRRRAASYWVDVAPVKDRSQYERQF
jgi:hypothetical protein